jgi:hypothetical protein
MRRPTIIILIVLVLAIAVAGIVQLNQDEPLAPFQGPSAPGDLPSAAQVVGD